MSEVFKKISLENAMFKHGFKESELIEVLREAQEIYGCLPKSLLLYIAERMDVPPSKVYGVATFYDLFHEEPNAPHVVQVCRGTACYVLESEDIICAIEREFNVKRGGKTEDGKLQLDVTRCIGLCARGPIVIVDGETLISNANVDKVIAQIYSLLERDKIAEDMKGKPYDIMNDCTEAGK